MRFVVLFAVLAATALAQDPPQGWLSYATASCPPGQRITKFSGTWDVLGNAPASAAFYSPWIGMDTTDNLNLLQPVNPWMGQSWSFYTEYFQWSPEDNSNSQSVPTTSGHKLKGSITWNGNQAQSYTILQRDTNDQTHSTQTINVQRDQAGQHKNYTILYVVFEKVAQCPDYPPNEKISFHDLQVECNGAPFKPQWQTAFVEDVCEFRAHVNPQDPHVVNMTWNTQASMTPAQKIAAQVQYGKNGALRAKANKRH